MTDLIKRTYRIKKAHDVAVKSRAKKKKTSESQIIRSLIEAPPTPTNYK